MNIQAMMKQAQKMQKDMMKEKEEIDETTFVGKSSFVTIRAKGTKEIIDVTIGADVLEKEDIEALQDMIVVAMNDINTQIDKITEEKMGKYTKGMPGLF